MSCTNLINLPLGCSDNAGGLREVYLFDTVDLTTLTLDPVTNLVNAITIAGGTPSIAKFEFLRETASFTDEMAGDFGVGSNIWTTTLNMMFPRRNASKTTAIALLAQGQRYLSGLAKDENGEWHFFYDLQLSAVGEGSGDTKASGSKYSVTLVSTNGFPVKNMSNASATTFLTSGTV
jgi:hypothetical protein